MDSPAVFYSPAELKADHAALVACVPILPVSCHHRQGMKVLEHFQPHFWETESPTGGSIAKNWGDAVLMELARERTAKHFKVIYKSEIRRNLAFLGKACLPTMYRPILTKGIVSKYNAKAVLDPCVGWGGRMIGTTAMPDTHFTGIEPFTKTFAGLNSIADACGVSDRVTLHNAGAEDILPTLPSNAFDLVLTSPPYFDLEVYSHEDTQSVKKFPTWEEWCEKFLEVIIRECLRCLKADGISAWSVKNMGRKHKLQDKVFEIHTKYGFKHFATEGMTATPRNTGKAAKITEETFLFRRG